MPWLAALRLAGSRWFMGFMWLGLALISAALAKAAAKAFSPPKYGGIFAPFNVLGGILSGPALKAANFLEHKITQYASHHMGPLTGWLEAAGDRQLALARANIAFAESVAIGIQHGFEIKVPREIQKKVSPWAKKAGKALALAGLTAAALRRYRHGIDRLLHDRIIPQVRHVAHATTVTLPRAIGRVGTRVRTLEDAFRNPSRAWVKRLANRLWLVGLAGLVLRMLARRFPWLFCRKISDKRKGVGVGICRMNQDLLDWLLAGTLLVNSPFTLEDFARQAVLTLDLFLEGLDLLLTDLHLAEPDYLGPTGAGVPSSFDDYLGPVA